MRLNRSTIFIISVLIILKFSILFVLWKVYNAHTISIETQNSRLNSTNLVTKFKADTLRLNEFVKSYIATTDPKYLIYYYDVLAILDGTKPEPLHYKSYAYWPAVVDGELEHTFANENKGESISQKMKNEHFSQEELAQLNTIETIREEIKNIEQIAFAATQGLYDAKTKSFIDDGEPNLQYASELLFSKKYINLTLQLYKAIDHLVLLTETRSQELVNKAENELKDWIFLVITFVIINAIIILALYLAVKKYLLKPVFELTKATKEISNKNYDFKLDFNNWLQEFQLLAKTFNTMSLDISDDIKIIEKNQLEIEEAKLLLEATHKKTKDSIEYASLIQATLIPNNENFRNFFKEFFIIWEPKDVVGGDIYFYQELRHKNESLLMVIDCTGHGVHGAFVTLLVKAIERNIVSKILRSTELVSPANILSIFNKSIKNLLKQDNDEAISSAGFDGQIVYFNKDENIIKFASARNEIIYIQNEQLNIVKGDKHSIGYKDSDENFVFKEHTITLSENTTLYLSSDGYWDQMGGEKERSFGKNRFKSLIEELENKSLDEQKHIFQNRLKEYQGTHPRLDDVTLLALKF